jgi:hypothetical protein
VQLVMLLWLLAVAASQVQQVQVQLSSMLCTLPAAM